MTDGSFVDAGATAVHEPPAVTLPGLSAEQLEHRDRFLKDVRAHLAVRGPSQLLEQLAHAHRYADTIQRSPTRDWSPTEVVFALFALRDPEGWSAAVRLVGDVIGEVREERQAASRG